METHYFWAFFVIALIAGGAITLGISNATMTGYAFFDFLRIAPVEVEKPVFVPTAVEAVPVIGCENCICTLALENIINEINRKEALGIALTDCEIKAMFALADNPQLLGATAQDYINSLCKAAERHGNPCKPQAET